MSIFSQFSIGNKPPTDISQRQAVISQFFVDSYVGVNEMLSGALTANVLSTPVDVTGSGIIKFLSLHVKDTTSRTIRLKVTIDGIVVYDITTAAITTSFNGINPIGAFSYAGGSWALQFDSLIFNNNYKVEIASSLTETDKLSVVTYYHLTS